MDNRDLKIWGLGNITIRLTFSINLEFESSDVSVELPWNILEYWVCLR